MLFELSKNLHYLLNLRIKQIILLLLLIDKIMDYSEAILELFIRKYYSDNFYNEKSFSFLIFLLTFVK